MNDRFWSPEVAYNPPVAITKLANHLSAKYNEYKSLGNSETRSWQLAVGSWNAPAVTDTLARGGTVSTFWYTHINNYIWKATALVDW
jgi:hypothetical protein